jgi:putative flavoprotein involved in K+ transport
MEATEWRGTAGFVDGGRVYRTVIVGGGQAGLAAAHALMEHGMARQDLVVLEAADSIAHAWKARWDSLRLFTPARYSGLEGMTFPGDPDHYPDKMEVAQYLEAYASRFSIPVVLNTRVLQVRHTPGGTYQLLHADGVIRSENVVVATGPFGKPLVPAVAERLHPSVQQLHSSQYRNAAQLAPGPVLVVGAGNSGTQIASELASTREVTLSVGSRNPALPQHLAGRDLFWWLEVLNVMGIPRASAIGKLISRRELLIGNSLRALQRQGVAVTGRIDRIVSGKAATEDGSVLEPTSIVWATGFRPDFNWLPAEVLTPQGYPVHDRGITPLPGLVILGQPWLHTRGSALIGWVKNDARHAAKAIVSRTD